MKQQILYGGDYNPDQWLDNPEILEQDIQYMKEAGINTVSMGIFSWSVLEPREGEYCLEWLEERINTLYENGIYTILATPSGARPRWMADRYPEVLRVDEKRVRALFGARHNHCYTSPVYREKVQKINTQLAKRFASHPAVRLWHISNEYSGECHCFLCQKAFREWLAKRYGTIEALNKSWWTSFWSHTYNSFQEIESPSSIGESVCHGLNLAWKRFVTEQTADFLEMEINALRDAGAKQPVTTNLMYDFSQLNYDRLSKSIDIVSWDSYPLWHKEEDIDIALDNAMQHDYMRSLKKKPFLLMESCPSATNWARVSKLKRPGILAATGIQALAHGSESVLYFQIRQSRGGYEKFHGAVIDHSGRNDVRVFQECSAFGESIKKLGEITGSDVRAETAILYDIENRWALEGACGPRNENLYYRESVFKSYRALRNKGLNVDVVHETASLEGYRLVIAPMLYLFHDGFDEKIRTFVENGGSFVLTYWSGIVDKDDNCFLGGTPYGVIDVFGMRRTETDALYEGEYNILCPVEGSFLKREYECRNLCDLITLDGGKALMTYGSEFYRDTPAVVENSFGNGMAYYVGTDAEQMFYDDFYGCLIEKAGITPVIEGTVPKGIEVSRRSGKDVDYVFVQNFKRDSVDIREMKLEGEILYGRDMDVLLPYESLVLKVKKNDLCVL